MTDLLVELIPKLHLPTGEEQLFCAVSGGADSLALMILLREAGRPVTAIHVDHGLRAGSATEARVVRDVATQFGADFVSESVHVAPGPNLEARARALRYSVLPPGVLTGHTADDLAETVLLNLMRGAGPNGLTGMEIDGHPLLSIRRGETRALCAQLNVVPIEDPSNLDPSILRNRVRRELLPLMDDIAERDVVPLLVRSATHLRSAVTALDALAAELDPTDTRQLVKADPELAARAVRRWLRAHLDSEAHPPDSKAVQRVLDVVYGRSRACDVVNGVRVLRTNSRLRLEFRFDGESGDVVERIG